MKQISFLFLAVVSGFLSSCEVEEPGITKYPSLYQKFIGGAMTEEISDMEVLDNGDVLVLGTQIKEDIDEGNYYLIKTDAFGNKLWEKTYGGSEEDYASDLLVEEDGSLVLAGYMTDSAGNQDYVIIRTDQNGNKKDSTAFGEESIDERATSIISLSSGGYVLAGNIYSSNEIIDNLFYRIDENMDSVWTATYGFLVQLGPVVGMLELSDGSVLWTGTASGSDNEEESDIIFSVLDADGLSSQIAYYGANNERDDVGYDLVKGSSGWVVSGATTSGSLTNEILVGFTFSNSIRVNWDIVVSSDVNQEAHSATLAENGNFLVIGASETSPENYDIVLTEIDFGGNILWEKYFGGDDSDIGYKVSAQNDQILMAGTSGIETNKAITLINTDVEGALVE